MGFLFLRFVVDLSDREARRSDTGDSIEFATEHYQPGFRFAF
jgi:hypothetical protein